MLLRTTVNTAIKGGSLRDNFKGEALRGALAVGQGYIGDIGQRYGLSEGGAAKVMMHSALGGTYALASKGNVAIGMLAGGMGEALSGLTSSPAHEFSGTGESGTGLSNWNDTIVAATAMLAGGSASDISTATTLSSSVVEYNYLQHIQLAVNTARFIYNSYRLANQIRNIGNTLNPAVNASSNTLETIMLEENTTNPLLNNTNINTDFNKDMWLGGINNVSWSSVDSDLKLPNILENRKSSKGNNANIKSQQKVVVSNAPINNNNKNKRDDENKKQTESQSKKRYKYTNYERGDDIGIERFTVREKGGNLKDPKSGQYLQKDDAFNSGSGPHDGPYKLLDRHKKRIGTVTKEGKFLRK